MLLLIFFIGFTQDFLVARYTKLTCQGAALSAANMSVLITILSVFVLGKILVDKNMAYAVSYFIGLWCGTFVATRLNK